MNHSDMEKKKWLADDQPDPTQPESDPLPRRRILLASIAASLACAGLLWFFLIRSPAPQVTPPSQPMQQGLADPPTSPTGEPVMVSPAPPPPALEPDPSPLGDSDQAVRSRAVHLSPHPRLTTWLSETDLIRRFVAGTHAIALGESPARLFEPLAPARPFKAIKLDEHLTLDPRNHRRYNDLVELLLSLDAELCTELYLRFEPQIETAYGELGVSGSGTFMTVLQKAVDQLNQTPLPPDRPELVEKTLSWAYADPAFEGLNAAQKHFMRLGAAHLSRLKGKMSLLLDTLRKKKGG
jgi:hypothetical protein